MFESARPRAPPAGRINIFIPACVTAALRAARRGFAPAVIKLLHVHTEIHGASMDAVTETVTRCPLPAVDLGSKHAFVG